MVAYAAARTPGLAGLLVALGCLGGVLLLTVLARSVPELLAWAIAPAGVVYAISLFVAGGAIDDAAPLVATALLLCGELAAWSLDARWRISAADERVRRARAAAVGALALSGLAASAAVVAVAAAPAGTGLAWTTLGAAAAVGAVGVTVAVLRRTG